MASEREWISTKEAKAVLTKNGYTGRTIYTWIKKEKVKAFKEDGKHWQVDKISLLANLETVVSNSFKIKIRKLEDKIKSLEQENNELKQKIRQLELFEDQDQDQNQDQEQDQNEVILVLDGLEPGEELIELENDKEIAE